MPPTSQAGRAERRAGASGLTLLEMLVVLAVLTLMIAALPRLGDPGGPARAQEETARGVVAALRAARSQAIAQARTVAVAFDTEARRYGLGEARAALPEAVGLTVTSARAAADPGGPARILFFADGSATGGRVVVSAEGARGPLPPVVIAVRWLTGGVSRDG